VHFDGTPLGPGDAVCQGEGTVALTSMALVRMRVRHAAYLVGLADAAFGLTLRYARERRQFGRPIAGFQAVSFRLAALVTRIVAARLLTQHAAWQGDRGLDIHAAAAKLLAAAGELARDVTAEGVQLHGAFGMTEAAEIQRYYRRAAVDALLLGTPGRLRQEAVEQWIDEPSPPAGGDRRQSM
jgi:alkylation response protein AidB-like acyl-CoA dehydrogenase